MGERRYAMSEISMENYAREYKERVKQENEKNKNAKINNEEKLKKDIESSFITSDRSKEDTKKFKEIAKIFGISGDELEKLKDKNTEMGNKITYLFTQDGKKFVEDILKDYSKSDSMEYIRKSQFNEFIGNKDLESLKNAQKINEYYVKYIDGFYQLFLDSGMTEQEAFERIKWAYNKYDYPKRYVIMTFLEGYLSYMKKLEEIDDSASIQGITQKENLLWLKFMNKQIRDALNSAIEYAIEIRKEMKGIDVLERMAIFNEYVSSEENDKIINEDREKHETVVNDCKSDKEIAKICQRYKAISGKDVDIYMALIYIRDFGREIKNKDLTQKEYLDFKLALEGGCKKDDKCSFDSIDKLKKEMRKLYKKLREKVIETGLPPDTIKIPWRETKDKELLDAAISKYECEWIAKEGIGIPF